MAGTRCACADFCHPAGCGSVRAVVGRQRCEQEVLVEGEVGDICSRSMGGGGWQQEEEEMEGQGLPSGRSGDTTLARMRHCASPALGSGFSCQTDNLL